MDPASYFLAFSTLALRTVVFWGHAVTSGIPTIDYAITSDAFEADQVSAAKVPIRDIVLKWNIPLLVLRDRPGSLDRGGTSYLYEPSIHTARMSRKDMCILQ